MPSVKSIGASLFSAALELYDEVEARNITYLVLEELLEVSRAQIHADINVEESSEIIIAMNNIIKRVKLHEPIQYVLGKADFYGLEYKVTVDTLIPRRETEELVEVVLTDTTEKVSVLDIGTGSGCIAITLAINVQGSSVTGIDVSAEALMVAKENAKINGVEVDFQQLDILSEEPKGKFDVIVSNPPYVRDLEKEQMHANVLNFEPSSALFVDDNDPLVFYRRIATLGTSLLDRGGKLYFEINEAFGEQTIDMLSDLGYQHLRLIKDMQDKNRIVVGEI